jgi:molybdopterin/thiamine biosynthesis adenylyltransferase
VRSWFERDPGRLDREVKAFAEAGIVAEIDEAARAEGILRVHLVYRKGESAVRLVTTYPDFYPYFRPEVAAPDLRLARHQTPNGGNLCLIGRRSSNWFAEDTVASVLVTQLPHLLEFERSGDLDQLAKVEEKQGEPASVYFNWEAVPGSYVLTDSAWQLDTTQPSGTFTFRGERTIEPQQDRFYVRGMVDRVLDAAGNVLASWAGPRPSHFDTTLIGRWKRLPEPILGNIHDVRQTLGEEEWARLTAADHRNPRRHMKIAALVFSEEVSHQQYADGWGFIVSDHQKQHKGRDRHSRAYFVRSARAGAIDLAARSASTSACSRATVVIVGLGAIGAPIALELARSGVGELRLVDGDHMEPSTARRWPIGWPAFARQKVGALADRILADYPWTAVKPYPEMIGRTAEAGVRRQGEMLEEILASADVVVDATAEMGVNHFLSDVCHLRKLPLIIANATPGARGGMVANFVPGSPCWMCLREALYGGSDQRLPLPPADESDSAQVQPAGCAEPTFSGSSFDLQEVSLEAARTAVSLLGMDHGYDSSQWQYACLSLDEEGKRLPPQWTTYAIPRRPKCPCGGIQ